MQRLRVELATRDTLLTAKLDQLDAKIDAIAQAQARVCFILRPWPLPANQLRAHAHAQATMMLCSSWPQALERVAWLRLRLLGHSRQLHLLLLD